MVIQGSSFGLTWCILSLWWYNPSFSFEAFLVREKKIFSFLQYVYMTAILFNDADHLELIENMPSTECPKCILVKIDQAVSEKKMFKVY